MHNFVFLRKLQTKTLEEKRSGRWDGLKYHRLNCREVTNVKKKWVYTLLHPLTQGWRVTVEEMNKTNKDRGCGELQGNNCTQQGSWI